MKLSAIKIDSARAEQGDWVGDLPDCGDLRLKVRGVRNSDARRLRQKLLASVPRDQTERGGMLKPQADDEISAKITAETILVDWANLTDENDQPIPFSKEKALELLLNPDYFVFRNAVSFAANMVADIEKNNREADQGN